ncbi:MAG: hypothetical protein GF400_08990 [Candidatus Eisenbacteria bacterium]|nr:hypothetical protein [Candidatus Eisenbacteria bacterium]
MLCSQVEKLLVEYAEGDLNAGEDAAVRDHLESCPACARELASIKKLRDVLRDDGYEEPSSFYWTRFEAGLRKRLRGGWLGGDDRWARLVPRLAPLVVAVAFFAVGMWMGLGTLSGPGPGGSGAPGGGATASFAEGPVVSPRTKLLVETGGVTSTPDVALSDTLAPEGFDPFGEGPGMILTGSEEPGESSRYLGEPLIGE